MANEIEPEVPDEDEDDIGEQGTPVFSNNGKFTDSEKSAIIEILKNKKKWYYDDENVNPHKVSPFGGAVSLWKGDDLLYNKPSKNNIFSDLILAGNFNLIEKMFMVQTTLEAGGKRRAIRASSRKYKNSYETGYHINYYMCFHI